MFTGITYRYKHPLVNNSSHAWELLATFLRADDEVNMVPLGVFIENDAAVISRFCYNFTIFITAREDCRSKFEKACAVLNMPRVITEACSSVAFRTGIVNLFTNTPEMVYIDESSVRALLVNAYTSVEPPGKTIPAVPPQDYGPWGLPPLPLVPQYPGFPGIGTPYVGDVVPDPFTTTCSTGSTTRVARTPDMMDPSVPPEDTRPGRNFNK